jgi:dTDP-4-amino-4,6-dideoxygalactose transaminase
MLIKLWLIRKYNLIRSYYNHFIKHRNDKYKVTVLVTTYNQSGSISRAIDSALNQNTNFKYKILIADDSSTDGAQDIIKDYEKKYPDIIFSLINKKNIGCPYNRFNAMQSIDTEYWILLNGDDFWTDYNKLQIQFDIMNKNMDCVYTSHPVIIKYLNSDKEDEQWCNYKKGKHINKPLYSHTTTKFFRNLFNFKNEENKFLLADGPNCYNSLFFGNWYFINRAMSVYNIHEKGVYTSLTDEEKKIRHSGLMAALYLMLGGRFVNKNEVNINYLEKLLISKNHQKYYTKNRIQKIRKFYNKIKKESAQELKETINKYQKIRITKIKKPILVTRSIKPNIARLFFYLFKVLASRRFTNNGKYTQKLERKLKNHLSASNISLFNNGTTALMSALEILDLPKGSEIITTPFTFPATIHAIRLSGYEPVFVDIKYDSMNIDPQKIKEAINKNTSAILGVHVYGMPCDVNEINKIANQHNIKTIYDGAHSFNCRINGKPLSNYGDATMHSFHATKLFHTLEGGCLITNNKKIKERADLYKNFGIFNQENVASLGINGKMNEFQAVVGLENLKILKKEIQGREKLFNTYNHELQNLDYIELVKFPKFVTNKSFQYYPIRIKKPKLTEKIYMELKKHNIFTRRYFYPLCSNYECYNKIPSAKKTLLPIANEVSQEVLCLPFYRTVSDNTVKTIHKVIADILKND